MPNEPIQQILAVFEIGLLLTGTFLFFQLVLRPAQRSRWMGINQMPPWPVASAEFAAFILLLFASGFFLQAALQSLLKDLIGRAIDRQGLEIFVYGAGFHGGALLGWLLFPVLRQRWHVDYGGQPPAEPLAPSLSIAKVVRFSSMTVLASLPVLCVLSLGWTYILRTLGLPDEPQDLIAIFSSTRSHLVIAGMLVVACILAPLNEELIFRAGLYRFCRQKLGRRWAMVVSGCLFGAMHGNWAGFLPLAVLGAALALAYEATGSIRVAVVAHGLFNLNTILIVLSGLPGST